MSQAQSTSLRIAVGDQMPSVGLRATDGYLLNLRSFVTKQPACFLFFGAATLDPSRRERGEALARAFAANHAALTEAGIAVAGVTCDSERQQTDYVAAANLPYLLFSDERRTAVELLGIPTVRDGENFNIWPPVVVAVTTAGAIAQVLQDPDPRTAVDEVISTFARAAVPGAAQG